LLRAKKKGDAQPIKERKRKKMPNGHEKNEAHKMGVVIFGPLQKKLESST